MKKKKTKGQLLAAFKRKCLRLWSQRVRDRAQNKCEWCGVQEKYLNCHHIVSKKFRPLRYDLHNGVLLCVRCHKWGMHAAHNNPILFLEWLIHIHPDYSQYLKDFDYKKEYVEDIEKIYKELGGE